MRPQSDRETPITPPYVSFTTFRSLISWLETEGVPHRFDRSFWHAKFSGSTGTQLVAALRFLGLLSGDTPQSDLERLVRASRPERQQMLTRLLSDSYHSVRFDELPRATPAMVREQFASYPVDGNTLRKAVSFFVNAAKEADIPLSNAVRKMARSKGARSRRDAAVAEAPARAGVPRSERSQTTVHLRSGGAVTLNLAVDLFKLSKEDREFVLRLVDMTRSYSDEQRTAEIGQEPAAG